ncbi:LptF/LptG family permease [Candidatus Bipolaricaulota bacterium]|nr:LptF/LptG family permease [Candidatus Bipolaricaulota bacterium]
MRFRRCDRYLLREVAGPFVVAAVALYLFIVLSLVLSLSDLMVDRGAGIGTLLRLLVLKSPVMLVLALPVSGLFAMFLGLGRLAHDREILAFQAAGVSLRRLTIPLILFAAAVSVGDFALYNWGVPSSEQKYQEVLQGVIYRSGIPSIRSNTFFSGPNGEVYFVRQYDESDNSLRDIVIYDVQGRLVPQAEADLLIVTAERGEWHEASWKLGAGRAYGYDEAGVLLYTGTFAGLDVPLDLEPSGIYASSRPATAMSMGELNAQIGLQRGRGIDPSSLEIEYHRKMAVPLASIVFVLLGASLALIYGWKSRGTGIAISFILVGAYQGFYVWMGSLGGGGVVAPWLAAWLPNIVFGAMAVGIFLGLDRFGPRDFLRKLRRVVPFFSLLAILVAAIPLAGQETIGVRADTLAVSADGRTFTAQGSVEVMLGETLFQADRIGGEETADGEWRLEGEGNVRFADANGLGLFAEQAMIGVARDTGGWHPIEGSIAGFELRGEFVNSAGAGQVLWVRGASGELLFSEDGEIERIVVSMAQFSTCEQCVSCDVGGDYSFEAQPYALRAREVTFYPDRLILAAQVTGYLFGLPVIWVPAYVQPLEETLASPLFPAIGRDALRGWYLKWNVPFFFSDEAYGVILFDLFGGVSQIGFGGEFRYTGEQHDARLAGYAFPAGEQDSIYTFEFGDTFELAQDWELGAAVEYEQEGVSRTLDYQASLAGPMAGGTLELVAARERVIGDDGEEIRVTDRLPELTFAGAGWPLGPVTLIPVASAGFLSEASPADAESDVERRVEVVRARAGTAVKTDPFSVLWFEVRPGIDWEFDQYWIGGAGQRRSTLQLAARAESAWGILLDYRLVHVWGESPLVADGQTRQHKLRVDLLREDGAGFDLRLTGGVDLAGLEPLPVEFDATWRSDWATGQSAVVNASASYSLEEIAMDKIEVSSEWIERDGWRAAASSGMDVAQGEWLPLTWSVDGESRAGWWSVSSLGEFDPNTTRIARAELSMDVSVAELRRVLMGGETPLLTEDQNQGQDQDRDRDQDLDLDVGRVDPAPDSSGRRDVEPPAATAEEDVRLTAFRDIDIELVSWSVEFRAGTWEFTGRIELRTLDRWGASLGGRWTSLADGVFTPEVGVFREFSNCLRIGIESTRATTWLYISIQAFPEAVLRYAPLQGDVEIGS